MLFRNKNEPEKLQIDLGDLQDEKERLASYLQTHFKIEVSEAKNKLTVDQDKVNLSDLHHAVKKFVYHRDLNTTHFITLEGSAVKINRFKGPSKKEREKHDKGKGHQNVTQSWGL